VGIAKNLDIQHAKSEEQQQTTTVEQSLEVPPGTYGVAALLLLTESTQMQFACLEGGKEVDNYRRNCKIR
jgi:hypothetical protein